MLLDAIRLMEKDYRLETGSIKDLRYDEGGAFCGDTNNVRETPKAWP